MDGVPTYEYRCKACEREFEVQQRMSDPDLVHCDACGADALERLISWTSVRNNNWQAALRADNPKEAFKGISAVDRSRSQRFGAKTDATVPPADVTSSNPAGSPASGGDTLDEDDEDAKDSGSGGTTRE
ncbi:MAG TPA: zinc ribbon domain-containing protein [Kofleriaceae bacterium]|nr:zinc ribbon domain-containing protein [Kofleriaceae bacterium]